ncbi:MAG: hypothetical protein ABSF17_02230 [Terracidiphilus sp.]
MKKTRTIGMLATLAAALLPAAAISQVSSAGGPGSGDESERTYKYDVYAGYAYSSLNQVNESRYGLQGGSVAIRRDFGRYFGVFAQGDAFQFALKSGNPGKPTVQSVFLGPDLHAAIYGKVSGFFHGLLGGEHTGGESETPRISFAGGVGGGLEYTLSPRFSLRASGDYVGASFSLTNNTAQLANSPHKTWNSRAGFGAVYHF